MISNTLVEAVCLIIFPFFFCLIFHNLQLAEASGGSSGGEAKKGHISRCLARKMNNRTEATLLQSGKLQVIPFSLPGFLRLFLLHFTSTLLHNILLMQNF